MRPLKIAHMARSDHVCATQREPPTTQTILREARMKREMLAKIATAVLVALLALNLLTTFVTRAGGKPDTDARIH